jgi:hypothetical protein
MAKSVTVEFNVCYVPLQCVNRNRCAVHLKWREFASMPKDSDQENAGSSQSSENIEFPRVPKQTAGAVAGAALGSVAGPIGAVIGGVAGAVAASRSGKGRALSSASRKTVGKIGKSIKAGSKRAVRRKSGIKPVGKSRKSRIASGGEMKRTQSRRSTLAKSGKRPATRKKSSSSRASQKSKSSRKKRH